MSIGGLALVEQFVDPRGARRPAFDQADHLANRQQQPQVGVDHLEVAHVGSLGAHGAPGTSPPGT